MYVRRVDRPKNMFLVSSLEGGSSFWLPNPDTDAGEFQVETMVNSGRNAAAVVVAQKIGRDQDKTKFKWNFLNKDDWENILKFFNDNFFFNFTYYSAVFSTRITRKCYISDRYSKPFAIDSSGIPVAYKDCSLSIVDTGEGE